MSICIADYIGAALSLLLPVVVALPPSGSLQSSVLQTHVLMDCTVTHLSSAESVSVRAFVEQE